ncbi:MAG TPA: putative metallopeptidase [Pyrinomonadaceae bacterium]
MHEPGDLWKPAPEVYDWFRKAVVDEKGPIHNPEHTHLKYAKIGVLWSSVWEGKGGVEVIGTAEILSFRGKARQKARQEIPFRQWFGSAYLTFDFLITLYAPFFARADDYTYCSGVEHEFLHCGQAVEDDGKTKRWKKDGSPIFDLRSHDVEVFVSEWRRYGAGAARGASRQLAEVAGLEPEVGASQVRAACGTCLRLVA